MRSCLILSCLFVASLLAAQDTLRQVPRLTFKLNATSLVNPFKWAVSAGSDLRILPRVIVDAQVGMYLGSVEFADEVGEYYRGLRLRGGLKFIKERTSQKQGYMFIGPLIKYNDIDHRRYATVRRQGSQYQEDTFMHRSIRSLGISIYGGRQFFLDKARRIIVEPVVGLGVYYHQVQWSGIPNDAIFLGDGDLLEFEIPPGRSQYLDITMSLLVGIEIW